MSRKDLASNLPATGRTSCAAPCSSPCGTASSLAQTVVSASTTNTSFPASKDDDTPAGSEGARLHHVLRQDGHDVSKFDDAMQTQGTPTLASLFEQMSPQLDEAFALPLTTDINTEFARSVSLTFLMLFLAHIRREGSRPPVALQRV